MKKVIKLSTILFFLLVGVVSASTSLPLSGFNGRADVYEFVKDEINTIEPESCKGVESIAFLTDKKVVGEVTVRTQGDSFEGSNVSNPVEYCSITREISEGQVLETSFNVKVRKSWLESKNLTPEKVQMFVRSGEEWKGLNTERKEQEDDFYYFYNARTTDLYDTMVIGTNDTQQSQNSLSINDINPLIFLICCCFIGFILIIVFLFISFLRAKETKRGGFEERVEYY